MEQRKLKIRDLTMRDGQQSLFATRMPQTVLDSLGIKAFEHGVGIRNITKQVTTARKGRQKRASFHGLAHLAQTVPRRLVEITHYRVGHSTVNDLDNVKESIRMINELGGIPDGAVCYTVDPKEEEPKGFFSKLFGKKPEKIFTDEYFVEKAKAMEAYGAKIITLKDMAGLVNPSRIATIMPKLKRARVSTP